MGKKKAEQSQEPTINFGLYINQLANLNLLKKALTGQQGLEYAIALKQVEPYLQVWEEKRQALVMQFGKPTAMGRVQVAPGTPAERKFQGALQEAFSAWQGKEIPFNPPKIGKEDILDHEEITAEVIAGLDTIFHWLPEAVDLEVARKRLNGEPKPVSAQA